MSLNCLLMPEQMKSLRGTVRQVKVLMKRTMFSANVQSSSWVVSVERACSAVITIIGISIMRKMVTTRMSIMVMRRECFLSILWWLRQRLKYIHQSINNINFELVFRLDYLSPRLHLFGMSRALRFSARISPQNSKALKTTNDMHGNRWMKNALNLKFC